MAQQDVVLELRQAGLSASVHRCRILEYMRNHRNHPTADQIYIDLRPMLPSLSKMTVYNTLRVLQAKGFLRDVCIEPIETRYDCVLHDHGHFKCMVCGNVFDFDMPQDTFSADMLEGFRINQRDVFYRGVCPDCGARTEVSP